MTEESSERRVKTYGDETRKTTPEHPLVPAPGTRRQPFPGRPYRPNPQVVAVG